MKRPRPDNFAAQLNSAIKDGRVVIPYKSGNAFDDQLVIESGDHTFWFPKENYSLIPGLLTFDKIMGFEWQNMYGVFPDDCAGVLTFFTGSFAPFLSPDFDAHFQMGLTGNTLDQSSWIIRASTVSQGGSQGDILVTNFAEQWGTGTRNCYHTIGAEHYTGGGESQMVVQASADGDSTAEATVWMRAKNDSTGAAGSHRVRVTAEDATGTITGALSLLFFLKEFADTSEKGLAIGSDIGGMSWSDSGAGGIPEVKWTMPFDIGDTKYADNATAALSLSVGDLYFRTTGELAIVI